MINKIYMIGLVLLFTATCKQPVAREDLYPEVYRPGFTEIKVAASKDPLIKSSIDTTIFTPNKVEGNILVLPGWKFNRKRWLNETRLVELAQKNSYRLICPEMNISLYSSKYYPETKMKWAPTPGLQWIMEILIVEMQHKKIMLPHQANYIMGLSTGGRGTALITLQKPKLWKAAAILSGDFDQSKMINDKLMGAVYGPYARFKERWQTVDNPQYRAKDWAIPLYLAHGRRDAVVPFSQSQNFYNALKSGDMASHIQFSQTSGGHDFKFWDSQLDEIMIFFNKYRDSAAN